MTKTLVCGDLHTKYHLLDSIRELGHQFDKVVFLGDYVDEWGTIADANYNLLWGLIDYKEEYPDKVVLLLGNHDLSEWMPYDFQCSGFNTSTHNLISGIFEEYSKLFQMAYSQDNYLMTHAGLTTDWAKQVGLTADKNSKDTVALQYATKLNQMFESRLDEASHFTAFAQAGGARGGIGNPSPIWADKAELIARPVPFVNQIVGHTPVSTVHSHEFKNGDGSENHLWFCDTHSLLPDYTPIGDNSVLGLEEDLITIMKEWD